MAREVRRLKLTQYPEYSVKLVALNMNGYAQKHCQHLRTCTRMQGGKLLTGAVKLAKSPLKDAIDCRRHHNSSQHNSNTPTAEAELTFRKGPHELFAACGTAPPSSLLLVLMMVGGFVMII